jgi:NADPH:quinone reductase-like Zn-dependent oxidoreductase
MKAIQFDRFGGAEVLGEADVDVPQPSPARARSASVSRPQG